MVTPFAKGGSRVYEACYEASILLSSQAYEGDLNRQILAALGQSVFATKMALPKILPGSPNRAYFLERFLTGLACMPFSFELVTSEQEVGRRIDAYESGMPDPVNPGGTWRALSLDIRLELAGRRDAKLYLREFPAEELVMATFDFDPIAIKGGRWQGEQYPGQTSDLPHFRTFLLALSKAYSALIGTLGLDVNALIPGLADEKFHRRSRMSLDQLTALFRDGGAQLDYDCVVISPAVSGGNRPFRYDRIEPKSVAPDGEPAGGFHDLRVAETLRALAEKAEQAYERMYESRNPKDDKDDALGSLSKAIELAGSLGLEHLQDGLKKRYEHINSVFQSQFRR